MHAINTEKYWQRVTKTETCWLWTGSTMNHGYGQMYISKRLQPPKSCLAHRLSWEIFYGEIPNGLEVLHKCDNPRCVNPAHLFLGTQQDNLKDMRNKGRGANPILFGEDHPKTTLTTKQVQEIKYRLKNYKRGLLTQLANEYKTTKAVIYNIRKNKTWVNV